MIVIQGAESKREKLSNLVFAVLYKLLLQTSLILI